MFTFVRKKEIPVSGSGDDQHKEDLATTVAGLSWWGGASLVIILISAIGESWGGSFLTFDTKTALVVLARATMLAAAASSVGGLLGFLFGIPRTFQQEMPLTQSSQSATDTSVVDYKWNYRQGVNTNLEQISDWLTKILVGVGLTQLNDLPERLWQLATNVPVAGSIPYSMALILNFLICGFFAGYLLTRLFLAGAFYKADTWLRSQTNKADILSQVGEHEKAVSEYEKALQGVTPSTPKAQKRSIYEGLILNFLYQDPPGGFENAIKYAQRYIAEEPTLPSATIWVFLAAAYGQQYKYELDQEKGAGILEPIKAKAIGAVREALRIDPQIKGLLQMMWDPKSPLKSPGDDDLEVFYGMEEFKTLLS